MHRLLLAAALALGVMCTLQVDNARAGEETEVAEDALLSQINSRIDKPRLAWVSFVQNNYIQALQAPLISTGKVFTDTQVGLAWYVIQPLPSKLIISDQGIDTGNGLVPSSRTIAQLLRAVIVGELTSLVTLFSVSGQINVHDWTLHLVPRDATLASRIHSLNLSGSNRISRLEVKQPTGNRILVTFSVPQSVTELPQRVRDDLYAQKT